MRRSLALLTTVLAAGCGGHAATPSSGAAPAAAPPAARPAADPSALRYGASTGRYRLTSSTHSVTDMQGQSQVNDVTTTLVVTATLAEQAGNIAASFRVDSTGMTGANPQMGDINTVRGLTYLVTFLPTGKAVSLVVPDTTNATAVMAGESFRNLLPLLPPSPISVGQTWADTASDTQHNAGMTIQTRSIRENRVVGWESHDGGRQLHIATTAHYSLTGEGEAQGTPIQLNGTGTATTDRFISAAGVFVGLTASDSANIMVTVPAAGLDIPVHRSQRSAVTRLP